MGDPAWGVAPAESGSPHHRAFVKAKHDAQREQDGATSTAGIFCDGPTAGPVSSNAGDGKEADVGDAGDNDSPASGRDSPPVSVHTGTATPSVEMAQVDIQCNDLAD